MGTRLGSAALVRSLGLLAALAMLAAACGDSDDDTATGAGAGGGDGGSGGGTVLLGQVTPQTAFLAEFGAHQVAGVQLAIDQVNADGGLDIGGERYQVEVRTFDDQCEPTEAVSAMTRLVEDGAVAIIGSVCSSNTLAMRPVAERSEVVLITPASTAPDITEPGHPFMFRTVGHIGLMAEQVIPYGMEEVGATRYGMLAVNNDFGRSAAEFYGGKIEELGGELLDTQFYEAGTVDFHTTIERLFQNDIDGLFIAGGATEGAAIMRQLEETGHLGEVEILSHGLNTQEFAELAGAERIEGCCYGASGFVFEELDDESKQFVEENQEVFGSPPNEVVVYSYDAAMSVMRAMEKAGTVEDTTAIRDALADLTIEDYDPLNAIIPQEGDRLYDDVGQLHPEYVIVYWRDGEVVPVEGT